MQDSLPLFGAAERHGQISEFRKSPDQRWAHNRHETGESMRTNGIKMTAVVQRREWYVKIPPTLPFMPALGRATQKIKKKNPAFPGFEAGNSPDFRGAW